MPQAVITSVSSPPAVPWRSHWRLVMLVAVLAGFFLMHGASPGDSCAGLSTPVASVSQGADVATPPTVMAVSPTTVTAGSVTIAGADACGCGIVGTACVPLRLRPQAVAALFAVFLVGFATTPLGGQALLGLLTAGAAHARRRRARGVPVRTLVCVSRT